MIRFPQTGMGYCLLVLFYAIIFMSVMNHFIIAKDSHIYPFPKGIVQNSGQYPSSILGYTHSSSATLWFQDSGMLIDVYSNQKRHVFKISHKRFAKSTATFEKQLHQINVIGSDALSMKETLHSAIEVKDEKGQSLISYHHDGHNLHWMMPQTSDTNLEFMIEGAKSIEIDESKGIITLHSDGLSYTLIAPLLREGKAEFTMKNAINGHELTISPNPQSKTEYALNVPILFTSFIGGSMAEQVTAIALDQIGNLYVLGETETPDFPVSVGAYDSPSPSPRDIFITKFDSTGKNIVYSARIGGSQLEKGTALAVDSLGQVCITGSTTSTNFPTTSNAFQSQKTTLDEDAFIVKLNASGSAMLYGTFLRGMTTDIAHGMTLDANGDIIIAGATGILGKGVNGNPNDNGFPKTKGVFDTTYNGGALDAFVAKISPKNNGNNDLIFASFLGGEDIEIAYKVVMAKNGNIIIAGETASSNSFPVTTGAFQSKHHGNSDGFIAMFSPNADSLLYSTYIGGDGYERITSLMFDEPSQNVFYGGYTNSSGVPDAGNPNPIKFPMTNGAFDTTYNGGNHDGFIGKIDPVAGGALKFSSFIGGMGDDYVTGLGVDVCAAPYITGTTTSPDFPITDDAPDSISVKGEAYISKLNALANVLVFSSFFGNDDDDQSNAIVIDGSGAIYIGGSVNGNQVPGNAQSTNGRDGFVAKVQVGILPLKPNIEKKGELSFCKGDSVILDVTSRNLVSYQWKKNAVIIPGANTPVLVAKESGLYTVDVADASGCTGSESVTVIAFDRPGLKLDTIAVACPNDTIQLNAISSDSLSIIKWSPATGLSCTDCLNPLVFPTMNMVYTLTTIDTNGCSRIDTVKIYVIDSTALTMQNIADTITLCSNTKQTLQFPIMNSSVVDLKIDIVSFTDPLLSSNLQTITVPADSTIFIPVEFAGRNDIGPKVYGVNIADHCGSVKTATCIIDVQNPSFAYTLDSITEVCRTNLIEQTIRIKNVNSLKGLLTISSNDDRVIFLPSTLEMNALETDSITVTFKSDTTGLIPLTIRFMHDCGNVDSFTWNVNVISNPFEVTWNSDTIPKKSGTSFVKSFVITNQSQKQLGQSTTFDIGLVHEYSSLYIDSVRSNDCNVQVKRVGDTTIVTYSNCKNAPRLNSDIHFTSVIGETLNPWVNIASFRSEDPCIDPILNNASDTIELDAYGCELTTLSIGKANAQLISVIVSPDKSRLSIAYEIKERMPIDIHCISTVGQIIEAIHVPQKEAGKHELSIPLKGLSSGVYALHFGAGQYAASSLFMIME